MDWQQLSIALGLVSAAITLVTTLLKNFTNYLSSTGRDKNYSSKKIKLLNELIDLEEVAKRSSAGLLAFKRHEQKILRLYGSHRTQEDYKRAVIGLPIIGVISIALAPATAWMMLSPADPLRAFGEVITVILVVIFVLAFYFLGAFSIAWAISLGIQWMIAVKTDKAIASEISQLENDLSDNVDANAIINRARSVFLKSGVFVPIELSFECESSFDEFNHDFILLQAFRPDLIKTRNAAARLYFALEKTANWNKAARGRTADVLKELDMKSKTPFSAISYLKTEEDMSAHIDTALRDSDPQAFLNAIDDVTRARDLIDITHNTEAELTEIEIEKELERRNKEREDLQIKKDLKVLQQRMEGYEAGRIRLLTLEEIWDDIDKILEEMPEDATCAMHTFQNAMSGEAELEDDSDVIEMIVEMRSEKIVKGLP